jgi:hypothetical protein
MDRLDQGRPSSTITRKTDRSRSGFEPANSGTTEEHCSKELLLQLIQLTIRNLYSTVYNHCV